MISLGRLEAPVEQTPEPVLASVVELAVPDAPILAVLADSEAQPAFTAQPKTQLQKQPKPQASYQRLTSHDEYVILTLNKTGKFTQSEIAEQIGCSQPAVGAVLRRYTPTQEQARAYLEASSIQAAKQWVRSSSTAAKRGRHEPSRDLLGAIGVIELTNSGPNTSIQVLVQGSPGQPGTAPVVSTSLSPATFAPQLVEE